MTYIFTLASVYVRTFIPFIISMSRARFPLLFVANVTIIPLDIIRTFATDVPEEAQDNKKQYYLGQVMTSPLAPIQVACHLGALFFGLGVMCSTVTREALSGTIKYK